eukprot:451101-Amphidinium_carterae.1
MRKDLEALFADGEGADLHLVLSPARRVTLQTHSRTIVGIPEDAEYFAFCHGVTKAGADVAAAMYAKVPQELEDFRRLMRCPSFIYMSKEGSVLAVNVLAEQKTENQKTASIIEFDRAKTIPEKLSRTLSKRWVTKVTMKDAAEMASAIAWIFP